MKKCFTYVIMPLMTVIIAASVIICIVWSKYDMYTISPKACATLFSCSPAEFCEQAGKDTELQGGYTYARVDRNGNLILVLDNSELESWVFWDREFLSHMQRVTNTSSEGNGYIGLFPNKEDFMNGAGNSGFAVSDDYSKVTVEYNADLTYLFMVLPSCVKMQIAEGKDMETIKIEFVFEGEDEGEIQYQSVWPDDDKIYQSGTPNS